MSTKAQEIANASYGKRMKVTGEWVAEGELIAFNQGSAKWYGCTHNVDWKQDACKACMGVVLGIVKTPEVCEDCTVGVPHMSGSVDDVPLWQPGERKAYSGIGPDGHTTWAEMIEIEDDLKHAYD